MKKKFSILFMLPLIMGVSACSGKGGINNKGDVINDAFLKMNVDDYEKQYMSSFEFEQSDVTFENYASVNTPVGLLELTDSEGKKAVYNPLLKQFILEKDLYSNVDWMYGNLQSHDDYVLVIGIKVVDGKDVYKAVDHLGNVLYEGSRTVNGMEDAFEVDERKQEQVVKINIDNGFVMAIYSTKTGELISSAVDADPRLQPQEGDYFPAELLEGEVYDLTDYGHKGYRLVDFSESTTSPRSFSVFDKKNKLVSNIMVTEGGTPSNSFIIGDYYVYQSVKEVNEKDKNYSYSVYVDLGGSEYKFRKYLVNTYACNYMKGTIEEVKKFNYVFADDTAYPLYNSKGVIKYAQAPLVKILDNKLLEEKERSFIIDEKLALHDDVTNIDFSKIKRLGSNYYDSDKHILYNNKLQEILHVQNLDSHNNSVDGGFFVVASPFNNMLYAIAGSDGKLLTGYVYESAMILDAGSNKVLVKDTGEQGKVHVLEIAKGKKGQTVNNILDVEKELSEVFGTWGIYEQDEKNYVLDLTTGASTEFPANPSGTVVANVQSYAKNTRYSYQLFNNAGTLTLSGHKFAYAYHE